MSSKSYGDFDFYFTVNKLGTVIVQLRYRSKVILNETYSTFEELIRLYIEAKEEFLNYDEDLTTFIQNNNKKIRGSINVI